MVDCLSKGCHKLVTGWVLIASKRSSSCNGRFQMPTIHRQCFGYSLNVNSLVCISFHQLSWKVYKRSSVSNRGNIIITKGTRRETSNFHFFAYSVLFTLFLAAAQQLLHFGGLQEWKPLRDKKTEKRDWKGETLNTVYKRKENGEGG